MKKILLSIFAIALTVGLVSGTAYALFTDTVNVAGITMTSGNADLGVYDKTDNIYTPVTNSVVRNMLTTKLSNFYPGGSDYTELWFKNQSSSDIPLSLQVKIDASSTWNDDLGNNIYIAISETGDSNNLPTSGWVSLNWLKANNMSFGQLAKVSATEEYKLYKMFIKMSSAVDNTLANKAMNGNIVFTATQVLE